MLKISKQLFSLSQEILALLKVSYHHHLPDPVSVNYGAFLLDPGMGPTTYITRYGRIIWDDSLTEEHSWGVEGTRADVFGAVVVGAKKTGIHLLRTLLPPRMATASDCPECDGSGWFDAHGQLKDHYNKAFSIVCFKCAGLGWTSNLLPLSESVLETCPTLY